MTNGSLLNREEVRSELALADWVSVKVDAVDSETWRAVDRPHRALRLEAELEGLRLFARGFEGVLVSETMLVAGANDREHNLIATAEVLADVAPAVAYLAVPTRPPAESWVRRPAPVDLVRGYEAFARRVPRVELLTGEPPEAFAPSSNLERDLMAITAVHPLDEGAVLELGGGSGQALEVAEELARLGRLDEVVHRGRRFFVRSFARQRTATSRDLP